MKVLKWFEKGNLSAGLKTVEAIERDVERQVAAIAKRCSLPSIVGEGILFQGDDGDFYSVKLVPAIFPAPLALVKKHLPDADTGWKGKLKALGVAKVEAQYNGEGDSGCIENVTTTDNKGNAVNIPSEIQQELDELCYAKLEEKHGGWEKRKYQYRERRGAGNDI